MHIKERIVSSLHRSLLGGTLAFMIAFGTADICAQNTGTDISSLIRNLDDNDVNIRLKAMYALSMLNAKDHSVAPHLIHHLNDTDMEVRFAAVVVLGKLGTEAIPSLLQGLESTLPEIRRGSAEAIGRIGPVARKTIPTLVNMLNDAEPAVREKAAEALGDIGPVAESAIQPLIRSLADADLYVCGKATSALASIGQVAVAPLMQALKSQNATVRQCAATALGKLGADAHPASQALIECVDDAEANVRWCAVMALLNLGDHARNAVPALLNSLHDRDEDVRWAATLALREISTVVFEKEPNWRTVARTVDSLMPGLMNEHHVPGVSVALVADRILTWSKNYGVANVRDSTPVTKATLFEACSMTKPVFAYTVLKLAEQGRVDLDRPLVEYLNEPLLPSIPERKLITARMVLSHTSGLPNWRRGEDERGAPLPVLFTPGSKFSYSGEGIYYLQRVIERITGEPLEVYARRTLFKPLGLERMSYVWTRELDTAIAAGHNADGKYLQKTRYVHANAAYTLYTTAEEYARFLIEVMKPNRSAGYSLLQASVDTMLSPQVRVDVREPIGRPGDARGSAVYWGLGWSLTTTRGGKMAHHSGANRSGFRCFSQFSLKRGTGIVIMTNGVRGDELWGRLINVIGNL